MQRPPYALYFQIHNGVFFGLHRNLNESDNSWLNNATHAYQIGADTVDCTSIVYYTKEAVLSQFMRNECSVITSLIYFYNNISEFKRLDIDDQVQLIKLNIRNTVHKDRIIIENYEDSSHIAKYM
ncbi:unnamed protein product [Adineta ricciae]|uniref:Uncharacterized protein n=1 Tax=Adineta ricciae TaxID=249248 RepID=A0A814C5S1_ADIRI|nr:unnamed protein product [Adineta ricciae]CAF1280241.1 unnamed protein product [Adineta ricciae]